MGIRIVRLGHARSKGEGLRLGTVRLPPRGVPKQKFASEDWFDAWLPNLAPALSTMKLARAAETEAEWARFVRKYRAEMAAPEAKHLLELLAALSHQTSFSVGCYCEHENRCHRSVLRELLAEKGAHLEPANS